jgi:hypothetical protein
VQRSVDNGHVHSRLVIANGKFVKHTGIPVLLKADEQLLVKCPSNINVAHALLLVQK